MTILITLLPSVLSPLVHLVSAKHGRLLAASHGCFSKKTKNNKRHTHTQKKKLKKTHMQIEQPLPPHYHIKYRTSFFNTTDGQTLSGS